MSRPEDDGSGLGQVTDAETNLGGHFGDRGG